MPIIRPGIETIADPTDDIDDGNVGIGFMAVGTTNIVGGSTIGETQIGTTFIVG